LGRAAFTGLKHQIVADAWSQMLFYGLLGSLLVMGTAQQGPSAEQFTGYVLVTLYKMAQCATFRAFEEAPQQA
jgi:hypothetical protein